MKKHCEHGMTLPRGLKCDRGFLVLTITHKGRHVPSPGCGPHNKESHVLAVERLNKIRSEIMRGKFGYEPELPEKTFDEVIPLYMKHWAEEKHGDGRLKHPPRQIYEVGMLLERQFKPYFDGKLFHEIRTIDIERRRDQCIAKGLLGTSVNRQQSVLSSMFTKIGKWIERGKIARFKLPPVNPCTAATKAEPRKRKRIISHYEYRKLMWAFQQLKDFDGVAIMDMAIESTLSRKDLKALEVGTEIDLARSKTGVSVNIPVAVLVKLNFKNWRKRWEAARTMAGLTDVQFRDLRKSGGNWLKGSHDMKLISEYMGHTDVRTTENVYMIKQAEKLRPLQEDLHKQLEKAKTLPIELE